MGRRLTVVVALGISLALPARAAAVVGLYPTTRHVPVGGVVAGHRDGSVTAAHVVPDAAAPRAVTARPQARPQARTVRLGPGRAHRQFLVSEPAGVILLLRLTVPHGARVVAAGSIPGVAGVRISTRSAACRRAGRVDVCTQPEEWCPMPAAAWHVRLGKISGPAGDIGLDFVVGSPQR